MSLSREDLKDIAEIVATAIAVALRAPAPFVDPLIGQNAYAAVTKGQNRPAIPTWTTRCEVSVDHTETSSHQGAKQLHAMASGATVPVCFTAEFHWQTVPGTSEEDLSKGICPKTWILTVPYGDDLDAEGGALRGVVRPIWEKRNAADIAAAATDAGQAEHVRTKWLKDWKLALMIARKAMIRKVTGKTPADLLQRGCKLESMPPSEPAPAVVEVEIDVKPAPPTEGGRAVTFPEETAGRKPIPSFV